MRRIEYSDAVTKMTISMLTLSWRRHMTSQYEDMQHKKSTIDISIHRLYWHIRDDEERYVRLRIECSQDYRRDLSKIHIQVQYSVKAYTLAV